MRNSYPYYLMLYFFSFLSLALLLLSGCNSLSKHVNSTNWLIVRSDVGLSGYTDSRLPDVPILLWSYANDLRVDGSPVVKEGIAYYCDRKGNIRGIDSEGKSVFHYPLNRSVEATGTIIDSVYYIGANDGRVSAVSLTRCDTLWTFETFGQVSGAPNHVEINGRKCVTFGSYDYYMYCVDRATGKEINRFESGYYINGSMAHWNQYVLFGGCDAWVRMVDLEQGAVVDSFQATTYIPASPAIRNNSAYVVDYGGNIYELTLQKGGIRSSKQFSIPSQEQATMLSAPACSDTHLVVLADSYLTALDRKTGTEAWRIQLKGKGGESSPIIARNYVIACTKEGQIVIADVKTGEIRWEYDAGEQIIATPAVIDRCFYILTTKGRLLCFG